MQMGSRLRMLAVIVLGLTGGVCAWGQGGAVPAPPPPVSGQTQGMGGGVRRSMEGGSELRWMTQQLNLTPEQKEKLRPIVTEQGDQLSAVRLDEHLPPDQKRAKTLAIREAFRPKIAAVLTPEQLEKWKKLQPAAPAPAPAAEQSAPPKQ